MNRTRSESIPRLSQMVICATAVATVLAPRWRRRPVRAQARLVSGWAGEVDAEAGAERLVIKILLCCRVCIATGHFQHGKQWTTGTVSVASQNTILC